MGGTRVGQKLQVLKRCLMSLLVKAVQENVFVSGPFPTKKIDKDFGRFDSTIKSPHSPLA